jgi:hypothetical protein
MSKITKTGPTVMPTHGEEPLLIAVLGVTGAGKSTFINRATGSTLPVGYSIISCMYFVCSVRLF